MFGTITIPQAVYEEVVRDAPNRPGAKEIRQAIWIQTQSPVDQTKVDYLRADLDPGEAEALVLAEELDACWIQLDEPKARLAAKLLGLKFIGTVGVLLLTKRLDKISSVKPLLDELRAKKFFLSESVYQAVLKEAGE